MTPLEEFEILEGISSENFTPKDWARFERFNDTFGEEKMKKVEDFVQKHKEEVLHDYGWCKGNVILPEETVEERKPYWDLIDKKAEQDNIIDLNAYANGVEDGINWQKEKSFSEEEVEQMISSFEKLCYNYQSNKDWFPSKKSEWFEEFKKK